MKSLTPSRSVVFCFACPAGFSGQKAATEMVMSGLASRGWTCLTLAQPVLDRSTPESFGVLRYLGRLLLAWLRALLVLSRHRGHLCVNLGQTSTAFLRDCVPLLLGRLFLGKARVVVSLHGSVFMGWKPASALGRCFRFLLRRAGTVTVLGARQKAKLLELGLEEGAVRILVNSCTVPPLSPEDVSEKLRAWSAGSRPLRVLHLSSLIATKGFPEYVDALERLCADPDVVVEAVLCGKVIGSEFQDRFHGVGEAISWIESRLAYINQSKGVRLEWIRGASGAPKNQLFQQADIFVLPTRYAVEAQPLVLLEAMASGCCIVTTAIGEIPTILDETCAVLLPEASTQAVESALRQILADPPAFTSLAEAAHRRFVERYALSRHLDAWETLLGASKGEPIQ